MFDRLIRYLPVLDYIRKYKPRRILEVGSGSKGLGEFYDGEFWGADVEFTEPTAPNMHAVRLSENSENSDKPENQKAGKSESQKFKLPFENGNFDLVVCMDVMEHVKPEVRQAMIDEMKRVCFVVGTAREPSIVAMKSPLGNGRDHSLRRELGVDNHAVILGFPCGRAAEELSRKMLAWYKTRRSGSVRWMKEHVKNGLPKESFVGEGLTTLPMGRVENPPLRIAIIKNENLFICEWLLKLEENGRFLKLERFLFSHFRPLVEFFLRRVNWGKCYRKVWVIKNFPLTIFKR